MDKYHNLKLAQKLSARYTVYHIENDVVPTEDIVSALDILEMAATVDQSHVDQLKEKICQLTETNNIIRE